MKENESCKIILDCNLQANHGLEERCPDILAIDEGRENYCWFHNFIWMPYESKRKWENRKISLFSTWVEVLWNMPFNIIRVVIVAW